MSANRRLVAPLLGVASTLLGIAGMAFSVQHSGDDPLQLSARSQGVLDPMQAWMIELRSSTALVAVGIALLAFSAIEIDPDPRRRYRNWKMCGCLGVLLLPAPILGMFASSWISRVEIHSLVLPNPSRPETTASEPFLHSSPLAISAMGVALGVIGAALLLLAAWRGARVHRMLRDGHEGAGGWHS
jgi:hypothetical protein